MDQHAPPDSDHHATRPHRPRNAPHRRTVAVALGSGGARGLAHIAVLEALDELGVRPVAIAGASIGAMIGALYAANVPAKELRAMAGAMLRNRGEVMRRLLTARVGRITDLFGGLGNPVLVDAERFVDAFLPEAVPQDFADLAIPLEIVATDYWERRECVIDQGALRPAIAASMAIPGLMRPVSHQGCVLVDGGAVNPLPFDLLRTKADIVLAVDITGGPSGEPRLVPRPFEAMFATLQIMAGSIVGEKLKAGAPDVLIRPNVDHIRVLDFFRATAILKASEPAKEEVKRQLEAVLA
ncbi:patatin-like phospholipase family protein [Ancylobacter terrae]|uniref:patatin-like phospholipase family protein n=1 Tax=Ancylobacter sp. sgz301288 TaxID=3342077 RepID=UPI003858FA60